ncbi:MAG TPA: A24 family peptidase [Rhizomicrobium sp.]|jgi:leader peptidase (prepilin peptidase)/N-methyltransferase|nr:A24 family peptidase [Rhizomicrobium sp.]
MIWPVVLLLIIAPFIGSFAGVLVLRLPAGRPVLAGRSACDYCGATLRPADLVPLVSWLWLRGRCRYCRAELGYFFPLVEIAAMFVVAWAATAVSGWLLAATCVFGWLLLTLALIDWRTYLLPDPLNALLALSGLVAAYFFDRAFLLEHAIALVAGFAVFAAFGWLYKRLRGRDGLGLGDAKLLGALGAWTSLQGLTSVVLFAAVIGLVTVIALSFRRRPLSAFDRVPLGTFLALAGWLVWLYGPVVLG